MKLLNLKRLKRRKLNLVEILGIPAPSPSVKNRGGRKMKNKSVVFRGAAAAMAYQYQLKASPTETRILLRESLAVWQVNKMLKIGYKSSEEEVISKIMAMEQDDDDRAASLAAKINA